jgi:hypothetical protein
MKRRIRTIPADLLQLKERFEHWRRTRTGTNRTPLKLSKEAVTLSYKYGITLTSKQLGLNHVTLKAQREKFPEAFVTHLWEKTPTQAPVLKTRPSSTPIQTHFIELTSGSTPPEPKVLQVHCELGGLTILLKSPQANDWSQLFTGFLSASRLAQAAL